MPGNSSTSSDCDVIIIGGGPTGAAAATLLARHGHDVVVLDKDRFPRYHIGESMIPHCWFALERLGLLDAMDAGDFSVPKYSVQFVTPDGAQTTPFHFKTHTDHPCAKTWQVRRDDFDRLLLDHALANGAQVRPGLTVRDLYCTNGSIAGVGATDELGNAHDFRAPITIDASGRGLVAANRLRWRVDDPQLRKMSIWTYYKGAKRDAGLDEGATTVAYIKNKGWFWYIPLPDDTVSVGVVAEKRALFNNGRDLRATFDRHAASQAWIRDHLQPGRCIAQHQATGDFSYRSKHCAANGLVLAGDAFAFLDPVFSSGLFLALDGGVRVADAVHTALEHGIHGANQFAQYGQDICQGLEAMRRLVYAFYDPGFSFGTFVRAHPEFRHDMTDLLIGHVFKDYDPMFAAIGESADIPSPLTHGAPCIEPLQLPDASPSRS